MKKQELSPMAHCPECDTSFCWQPQNMKDIEIFKVTREMLEDIECPECGHKNVTLTAKNLDS